MYPFFMFSMFFSQRKHDKNIIGTCSAYGTREDRRFTYGDTIILRDGTNRIALFSIAFGLPISCLPPLLSEILLHTSIN